MQLLKTAKIENVLQSRGLNKTLAGDCCLTQAQQNVCLGFPYLPYFFALKNAYPNMLMVILS
jgi:hypothetical protein